MDLDVDRLCQRLNAMWQDIRLLDRAVADLRVEIASLRAAIGEQLRSTPPAP